MKQRDLSTKKINDAAKSSIVLEAQKEFMLNTNEDLLNRRTELFEKIVKFYQNEYIPVIEKHATILTLWNKLNVALSLRGALSETQVKETNLLLDNKLKHMFSRQGDI